MLAQEGAFRCSTDRLKYVHGSAPTAKLKQNLARTRGQVVTLCKVKKRIKRRVWRCLVRKGGLEPPRFYPPDPKFPSHGK